MAEYEFGKEEKESDISWELYEKFKKKTGRTADYTYYCKHYGAPRSRVSILPEDEPILDLLNKYFAIYVSGMGGINSHGLIESFNLDDIDPRVRGIYTVKLIIFINEALKQQDKPNGKKN